MAYKDPERQKAYAREWLKRFPEKARAAAKRWNHANPEKRREQSRKDRARNPEKFKAWLAAYHAAHPEVGRAKDAKYRARKATAPGPFTGQQWRALIQEYEGRCGYCGSSDPLQADHRAPLSRGGSNDISNIIPACRSCNCRKAQSSEADFRARLAREQAGSDGPGDPPTIHLREAG